MQNYLQMMEETHCHYSKQEKVTYPFSQKRLTTFAENSSLTEEIEIFCWQEKMFCV
jgi:hypothetical protein